jgi:hypothetical protein
MIVGHMRAPVAVEFRATLLRAILPLWMVIVGCGARTDILDVSPDHEALDGGAADDGSVSCSCASACARTGALAGACVTSCMTTSAQCAADGLTAQFDALLACICEAGGVTQTNDAGEFANPPCSTGLVCGG